MEEENEQLDYDELDDLETARKKCKELQKAVEIDALQAVKSSSNENMEDGKDSTIVSIAVQSKLESVPVTSQIQLTSFPQVNLQSCSTSVFSSAPSVIYSSNTPPPPGVSTVPIIASSFPPSITTNIPRPSLQQQHQQSLGNKFYVNPKFNNRTFRYDKRNVSKQFYKKFTMPPPTGYFPSISTLPTANMSQIAGNTIQLVGGNLQTNNQNLNVSHILGSNTLGLPPVLTNNLILNQQIGGSVSTSSFLPPTSGNNIYINRSVFHTTNSWNAMVDEFVRKNVSSDFRSRYNPSYIKQNRSRSSSRSTSRRSNSSSSDSSNVCTSLRNRSSSITDDNTTQECTKRRRIESVEGEVHHSRRRYNSDDNNGQKRSKKGLFKEDERNQAIECARAIGLDENYLKKIEEQQRLRDEVLRRKTQKRKEKEAAVKKMEIVTKKSSTKVEGLTKVSNIVEKQEESTKKQIHQPQQQKRNSSTNLTRKTINKSKEKEENISKLRPYLAVVCTNLRGITNVEKRIEALAEAIGKTKKIWRVGTDDCHIIFEKHEHAKEFMLQYYGKKLGTVPSARIDVALKKVFLNISSQGTD